MKYYLPIHLDGDNRGCEAITKGTSLLLDCNKENIEAYSSNMSLDIYLGLDNHVTLVPKVKLSYASRVIGKLRKCMMFSAYKRKLYKYRCIYNPFLDRITDKDIMLSTGGDMLCYANNEVNYTNDYLHKKGIRTVLWGCSVGEKNLTQEKIESLRNFTLVYARESLSYKVLIDLGLNNVCLYPDPAFILNPEKCSLIELFSKGDVVGVNLSNFVAGKEVVNDVFLKGIEYLFNYILDDLKAKILLIPHVLWDGQDDRVISTFIYNKFKKRGEIQILESETMNYCQIRYVISNCRFFIGARTHSVISAYSTYIPTLALGYSIKSKGIAKDLKLPIDTVVDCINMESERELLEKFIYLQEHEKQIKQHLLETIPEYKAKAWSIKSKIDNL